MVYWIDQWLSSDIGTSWTGISLLVHLMFLIWNMSKLQDIYINFMFYHVYCVDRQHNDQWTSIHELVFSFLCIWCLDLFLIWNMSKTTRYLHQFCVLLCWSTTSWSKDIDTWTGISILSSGLFNIYLDLFLIRDMLKLQHGLYINFLVIVVVVVDDDCQLLSCHVFCSFLILQSLICERLPRCTIIDDFPWRRRPEK